MNYLYANLPVSELSDELPITKDLEKQGFLKFMTIPIMIQEQQVEKQNKE